MFLPNDPADAVKFSVKPQRADMIQTTQHRRPATPRVRYRIVFFIERLIDKSIRISANHIDFARHFSHCYFAARVGKRSAVMPTALTLQRWRLRPGGSDSMLLSKHRRDAKEKHD